MESVLSYCRFEPSGSFIGICGCKNGCMFGILWVGSATWGWLSVCHSTCWCWILGGGDVGGIPKTVVGTFGEVGAEPNIPGIMAALLFIKALFGYCWWGMLLFRFWFDILISMNLSSALGLLGYMRPVGLFCVVLSVVWPVSADVGVDLLSFLALSLDCLFMSSNLGGYLGSWMGMIIGNYGVLRDSNDLSFGY